MSVSIWWQRGCCLTGCHFQVPEGRPREAGKRFAGGCSGAQGSLPPPWESSARGKDRALTATWHVTPDIQLVPEKLLSSTLSASSLSKYLLHY